MRSSDVVIAYLLAAATACSTTLPGGDLSEPASSSDAAAPLPVASGCMPFRDVATTMRGALRSLAQTDGSTLFIADDATVAGADVPALALSVPAGAALDGCLARATLFHGTPVSAIDPPSLAPLSGVGTFLYFTDPSGAIGVAAQDPSDGRFRPSVMRLFTSDRPAYGTAAVPEGAEVDVLGCRAARFLDADCFLARAPAAGVADESAYAYYTGGGRFSPRADDAWPMTTGAASLDIQPVGDRWVMVYVGPLGQTLSVRSGVTPEGPWSAPVDIARCDLADPDMFCAGVHLHPSIAAPPGVVVVSYAPASLSPGVGARQAAEPAKWWPRVAAITLPPLP